jgi:hypothetical protein
MPQPGQPSPHMPGMAPPMPRPGPGISPASGQFPPFRPGMIPPVRPGPGMPMRPGMSPSPQPQGHFLPPAPASAFQTPSSVNGVRPNLVIIGVGGN